MQKKVSRTPSFERLAWREQDQIQDQITDSSSWNVLGDSDLRSEYTVAAESGNSLAIEQSSETTSHTGSWAKIEERSSKDPSEQEKLASISEWRGEVHQPTVWDPYAADVASYHDRIMIDREKKKMHPSLYDRIHDNAETVDLSDLAGKYRKHALKEPRSETVIWQELSLLISKGTAYHKDITPLLEEHSKISGWEETVNKVHLIARQTGNIDWRYMIEAIGFCGDNSSGKCLLNIVQDELLHRRIRVTAAYSLGKIGDQSVVEGLVNILSDGKELPERLVSRICSTLHTLNNRSVKDSLKLISDDPQTSATTRDEVRKLLQQWEK